MYSTELTKLKSIVAGFQCASIVPGAAVLSWGEMKSSDGFSGKNSGETFLVTAPLLSPRSYAFPLQFFKKTQLADS